MLRRFEEEEDLAITIVVDTTAQYPIGSETHIRIGSEWIRVGKIAASSFEDCQRGVRGTTASAHLRNEKVVHGTDFRRTVRVPGTRDARGNR